MKRFDALGGGEECSAEDGIDVLPDLAALPPQRRLIDVALPSDCTCYPDDLWRSGSRAHVA